MTLMDIFQWIAIFAISYKLGVLTAEMERRSHDN
jgi:hypothetical protein